MTKPHHETGITDEVGVEAHDLIHDAEVEEQKVRTPGYERQLHGKDALCADDPGPADKTGLGGAAKDTTKHSKGPLDKVKDALHLNK